MRGWILAVVLAAALAGAGWYAFGSSSKHPVPPDTIEPITTINPNAMPMTLTSPAFEEGGAIPQKYTCDGQSVNPELSWTGAPEGTKSFALIMDDPDIPESVKQARGISVFDHWVVYNIPAEITRIPESAKPPGVEGLNGSQKSAYTGPCPPDAEHRYFFYLYALDTTLTFDAPPTRAEVEAAIKGHVLAEGQLMGKYNRKR